MTERTAHEVGAFGEKRAARYLFFHGYRIIGRNVRLGRDEIDVVAVNPKYIVFAEVKTRSVDRMQYLSTPAEAVNAYKRAHLIAGAKKYLAASGGLYRNRQPRIDVIEVEVAGDKRGRLKVVALRHLKNAVTG